ncbi:MAG TPA: T9SS type A sorting domain-containing protein, partial [Parafilimonas sp.]|nr:T9SS type A sorting domain-containing protein [Parafilimonas sp.]
NFRLYPNPAQHVFMLELALNESLTAKAQIQMINAQGSAVYTSDARVYNGQLKKQVTTSSVIVPGVYLVRITIGGELFVGKLIIER